MPKMIGRFEYYPEIILGYVLVIMVSYFISHNALNANALETANRSNGSTDSLYSEDLRYEQNQFPENQTQVNDLSNRLNNMRLAAEFFDTSIHRITKITRIY